MKKKRQPEPEPEPRSVQIYALSSGEIAVLPNESMEELEALDEELNEEFNPTTPHEQFLVDRAINARWKLYRYRRLETQAYADIVCPASDDDQALLNKLERPNNVLEKLERMIAATERAFSTAIRELDRYRAQTRKAEEKAEKQHPAAKIQNEPKPAEAPLPTEPAKLQNEPNSAPEPVFTPPPYPAGGPEPPEERLT